MPTMAGLLVGSSRRSVFCLLNSCSLRLNLTSSSRASRYYSFLSRSSPCVSAGVLPSHRSSSSSNVGRTVGLDVRQVSAAWEKRNQKLGRPMSPHLTIYKYQLTSVLSIMHRITGVALYAGLLGWSAGAVIFTGSFGPALQWLVTSSWLGWASVAVVKAGVGWMLFYHTANGVRHLFWDVGHGFSLPMLYRSGYMVLTVTTLATALLMLY